MSEISDDRRRKSSFGCSLIRTKTLFDDDFMSRCASNVNFTVRDWVSSICLVLKKIPKESKRKRVTKLNFFLVDLSISYHIVLVN